MVVPPEHDADDQLIQSFQGLLIEAERRDRQNDKFPSENSAKLLDSLINTEKLLARYSGDLIQNYFTQTTCERFCRYVRQIPPSGDTYDVSCAILRRCFAICPTDTFLRQYFPVICSCLTDKETSDNFRKFLLDEILTAFERPDAQTSLEGLRNPQSQTLLLPVAKCLVNDSDSVAQSASRCLLAVTKRQPQAVFSGEVLQYLQTVLREKDIIRMRMHELTSQISIISEEYLKFCVDAGFVEALLAELNSTDILCQLNILEILTDMTTPVTGADHCLRYFRNKGVITTLCQLLTTSQEAPDATFLFPAVIKFFGHLARMYPEECCSDCPRFLIHIFDLVLNYSRLDIGQRLLAFDTLGLIGSTTAGKQMLARHNDAMEKCVPCFGSSVKQGPMEMRVRHLEALGSLLQLTEDQQSKELTDLTERWFRSLDGSPEKSFQLIFELFRQPFLNMHCAAGELLKKLAVQPWARKLMANQVGFLEYVLNRTTEHTMEGRYVKYEIVKILADCPTISEAFDSPDVLRLVHYAKEGPFYVRGQAVVAVEDS